MTNPNPALMDKIVALCKRRGFIFPGSEIYGGLAGTWDYGPLGVALKNNLKNLWWRMFVTSREEMYGVDAGILMNQQVWQASGHVGGFSDPLVECEKCHHTFRADQIQTPDVKEAPTSGVIKCPDCGGRLSATQAFNMMFATKVGAAASAQTAYLRPETAQGMFVNFKNIVDTFHPKLPFGLGQVGKAFRNEIAPRDFLFRTREFEQWEVEYFVRPDDWENRFERWRQVMWEWIKVIGLPAELVHELEVPAEDRAHYSERTIDFEFDFPFGRKELYGLAYRADFDLKQHQEFSKQDLTYYDENPPAGGPERFLPHVIEPSLGVDRTVLAILCSAYTEDQIGGEPRTYLKFNKQIAPIKAAVFPLLKNKPELVAKAQEVYKNLKNSILGTGYLVLFDDNGNIGKRYRRQDEIGTPYCVTIDFDTLGDPPVGGPSLKDTVTLRDRDTGAQERVKIADLPDRLA